MTTALMVNNQGFALRWPDGQGYTWRWDEVIYVAIAWLLREDRFFFSDPAYFELQHQDGTFARIYSREARRGRLLEGLARLPGVDMAAIERDLSRKLSDDYHVLWSRAKLRCLVCGKADLEDIEQTGRLPWHRKLCCPACQSERTVGRQIPTPP